jgi:hypothetical protein
MCAAALKNSVKRPARKFEPGLVGPPKANDLKAMLEKAAPVWSELIAAMRERCSPFDVEWRPSKQMEFGRYCLLVRKGRRLLYMLPKSGEVEVMVALGDRAFDLAMESSLPARFKKLASEAKHYSEGRFIRFPAKLADVPHVVKLIEIKLTPK